MEFRAAPMFLAVFSLLLSSYLALYEKSPSWKQFIIAILLCALAFGASKGHYFYSKKFIFSLYSVLSISIVATCIILYKILAG
jgi:hypothetical protein